MVIEGGEKGKFKQRHPMGWPDDRGVKTTAAARACRALKTRMGPGTKPRGPTEDIIHYFTLMSSELHYLDIILKIENLTLMSSASGKITSLTPIFS